MLIGLRFLAPLMIVSLMSSIVAVGAEQKFPTMVTLEDVPSKVYEGERVILKGNLKVVDSGKGIPKTSVMLKSEDGFSSGTIIASGITDDDGRFSISWLVGSREKSTVNVYASYGGSVDNFGSRSEVYSIMVERTDLIVHTNKEVYTNGDQLIIFGSGRPKDVLSVFVTTTGHTTIFGGKITVDGNGKFNATLLDWDDFDDTGTYFIYARSVTDIDSYIRAVVFFFEQQIQLPVGVETVLQLDPVRSNVTINDNLLFTGKLETKTGLPIKEATILIMYKDDDKDGIITKGMTWDDGKFFINWKASQVSSSDLNVYASFEGGNGFLSALTDEHQIKFRPRKLSLDLNKYNFKPSDPLVVSGIAPPMEKLNLRLIDSVGETVVTKTLHVDSKEIYEKILMHWVRPSNVLPEGEYVVRVETEQSPVLTASKIISFVEPRPLSEYKIMGYVLYESSNGAMLPLSGARVKIESSYGHIESFTDHAGNFVFEDLHSVIEDLKNVFLVTVELDGEHFRLIDGSNSRVIAKRASQIKFDGALSDITLEPVIFSSKTETAAARIFMLQNDVVKYYTDVLGLQPEKIDIEIFSEETTKGKYGYVSNDKPPKIWIGKSVSSPRHPYTWDTLAHEYTHYMQDLYASVGHYQSMNHGGFSNPTTADSVVEGFANFMSAVIAQYYGKEQAGKFLKYDLEYNYKVDSPEFLSEELAVTGVFWDIYDSGEDDDEISLNIKDIWNIMSSEYYFPSYHKDSGVGAADRNVYYLKDLHYILTQGQYSSGFELLTIEDLFESHGIFNGFTDKTRPGRI